MKTKLLKKVRKRFEIIHYPNGINSDSTHERVVLIDNKNDRNNDTRFISASLGGFKSFTWSGSVDEAKESLLLVIISLLRREYKQPKPRKGTKIWHS